MCLQATCALHVSDSSRLVRQVKATGSSEIVVIHSDQLSMVNDH